MGAPHFVRACLPTSSLLRRHRHRLPTRSLLRRAYRRCRPHHHTHLRWMTISRQMYRQQAYGVRDSTLPLSTPQMVGVRWNLSLMACSSLFEQEGNAPVHPEESISSATKETSVPASRAMAELLALVKKKRTSNGLTGRQLGVARPHLKIGIRLNVTCARICTGE